MKRAAIVAGAVVIGSVGVALGTFAWTGGVALAALKEQSAAFAELSPSFAVVDEKVERGLFRSVHEATYRFGCLPALPAGPGEPASAKSPPEPLELGVRTSLRHGPLVQGGVGAASLESTLVIPDKWRQRVETLVGKEPPLRVLTKVAFDGSFESDVSLAALHFTDPQAGSFDTDVLRAHVTGSRWDARKGAKYELDMPSFGFHSRTPDASMDAKLGAAHSVTEVGPREDPALWLTDTRAHGTLDGVELGGSASSALGGSPKPFTMRFERLQFEAKNELSDGLWSGTTQYGGKGKFGDFAVDKVELEGALRRFHAATYQKLLHGFLSDALTCDPARRAQGLEAQLGVLQKYAAELLVHDPQYALDKLAVELEGKRGELSFSVGTVGVKQADLQGSLMGALMEHGVIKAHARVQLGLLDAIDKQLLASDPQLAASMPPGGPGPLRLGAMAMLGQLAEAGYLVQNGDVVESSLSYEGGRLQLNGRTPALPDLGGMLGGP